MQQAVPAALLDERRRVGLVDGVREQQRHQVCEGADVVDPAILGASPQDRNLFPAFGKQFARGFEPQWIEVGRRQVVPVVPENHVEQLAADSDPSIYPLLI